MSKIAPAVASHYQLICYIDKDRTQRPSPFEGWATWAQIRAAGGSALYAVIRAVPIKNHCGKVIFGTEPAGAYRVCSLTEARVRTDALYGSHLRPPKPAWTAPNADAAIMKAVMCHGQ